MEDDMGIRTAVTNYATVWIGALLDLPEMTDLIVRRGDFALEILKVANGKGRRALHRVSNVKQKGRNALEDWG